MSTTPLAPSIELPAAGAWTVDPGHTEVGFVGRHFGLTKVRGRFTDVEGTVTIGDDIADSQIEVSIAMASVSSGDTARDEHLRSGDFFDVERHPTATFRSTGLVVDGAQGTIAGELTLKDVTRPITLEVEYLGQATDPWGGQRAVFSAAATINREDWGLTWNTPLETGGFLLSKSVRLEIEAELIRK